MTKRKDGKRWAFMIILWSAGRDNAAVVHLWGKVAKAAAMGIMLRKIDKNYKENPDIKWNFTKFLVDRQGTVVVRFEPTGDMRELEEQILTLL